MVKDIRLVSQIVKVNYIQVIQDKLFTIEYLIKSFKPNMISKHILLQIQNNIV